MMTMTNWTILMRQRALSFDPLRRSVLRKRKRRKKTLMMMLLEERGGRRGKHEGKGFNIGRTKGQFTAKVNWLSLVGWLVVAYILMESSFFDANWFLLLIVNTSVINGYLGEMVGFMTANPTPAKAKRSRVYQRKSSVLDDGVTDDGDLSKNKQYNHILCINVYFFRRVF